MKETFTKYFKKHFPVESLLGDSEKTDGTKVFNQFTLPLAKRIVLIVLRIGPYLAGLGFLSSYFIQLGQTMEWIQPIGAQWEGTVQTVYYICVSGLIGFGTNWLAIRMLFRPLERRPIWGQGLIPAQRDRIVLTLASGMHTHILSQDRIKERIQETGLVQKINDLLMDGAAGLVKDEELRKEIKDGLYEGMVEYAGREDIRTEIRNLIDKHLEENLDGGIKKFLLQTYKRYNEKDYADMIDRIVGDIPNVTLQVLNRLETELDDLAQSVLDQKTTTQTQIEGIFENFLESIDITGLLAKQMENFDEVKLERMVRDATNEELVYIQYLGTILGALGGLLIAQPEIAGPIYVGGFAILWLLDYGIFQWQKKK